MLAKSTTLVALCAVLGLAVSSSPMRPNIVWIMADDMGWGEPENFPSTSPHGQISTPNLKKFGDEGIRFTDAYAGYTVCAPSRTTFFTGFHSGHFQREGLIGTSIPANQNILTTAQLLKNHGYATALVGKSAPLTSPTLQGFDFFIGQVDQALCHHMYHRKIDEGTATRNVNLPLNYKMPMMASNARQR